MDGAPGGAGEPPAQSCILKHKAQPGHGARRGEDHLETKPPERQTRLNGRQLQRVADRPESDEDAADGKGDGARAGAVRQPYSPSAQMKAAEASMGQI